METVVGRDIDDVEKTSTNFPVIDLVPKKETKALEFRTQNKEYDGRNVLIGILDTGIDPAATGIRYMEDGKTPKLVDIVDCTGSCDVDVSLEQEAHWVPLNENDGDKSEAGYWEVKGLSGRNLKLSMDWKICPFPSRKLPTTTSTSNETSNETSPPSDTRTVRLGLKRAYELFPDPLVSRVKAHRKKQLDKERDAYIATRQKILADFKQTLSGGKPRTPEETKRRDDLQAYIDVLSDSDSWDNDNDPGLLLDCVVFWDGRDYRAVIDPTESPNEGDLRGAVPMTDFRKELQFETVSTIDQYNYGVNFYDDGTVLSIVGDITPHGTHVAGIAAAADGDRSGVAPGSQLISIRIGDGRMDAMETGTALVRGIMTAVRLGCDVINLSFGEGSQVPNSGRVIQFAEELVWRHNIMFLSSAGNNGPALSSVNAPGGSTSCMCGVAAYVSAEMMKAEYSLSSNSDNDGSVADVSSQNRNCPTDDLVGTTFTWSSVGPAVDGFSGVSICAPGMPDVSECVHVGGCSLLCYEIFHDNIWTYIRGAIAPVSNWTMQKSMLMSGTSMASPHVCGCVALLISACKAERIPFSPPRIQRALENTAQPMPNLCFPQQGWGMIQVDKAFEHLRVCKDLAYDDVHFDVVVDGRPGNGGPRGIYLRQRDETCLRQTFGINVSPNFKRDDYDDTIQNESQRYRIDFEMCFTLRCTESWVSAPDHFMLMNTSRNIKVSVDPTNLTPGVHTAQVCGIDADHPERGVIWYLPITVVKPLEENRVVPLGKLEFSAIEVKRFFVVPPAGSTWMDVTIRDCRDASKDGGSSTRLLVLHCLQLIPHRDYRDRSQHKYINLLPSQKQVFSIAVEAGITCEIAIARYWSTAGITKAEATIEFRGIRPFPPNISMKCADAFSMVTIYSELQDEIVLPVAKLNSWKTPLRPKSEGVISVLGERDIQPWNGKKTYQLVLTYEFTQDEKGSFTPRSPPVQGVLYESLFESQMMMVFDGNKKYLGCSDAYPRSVSAPKGTVVIRMQIRHDNPSLLEKFTDAVIWIERKLDKEIPLSVFETREKLLLGKRTMRKQTLRRGQCASIFFAEPPAAKIPSSCKNGDILMGTVFYASGDSCLPGQGKRPGGFPIAYTVGPKMDKAASSSSDPSDTSELKDERTAEERMNEAIRDVKVDQLGKLTSGEKENGKFEDLFSNLEKEYPDHLPLFMASLKNIEGDKKRSEKLTALVAAADKVIGMISEDELALHFGKKVDKEDLRQVKVNKDMEKKKACLVEALARKAMALSEMDSSDASDQFDAVLQKLKAWVDMEANGKYAALTIERDCRASRHGLALKRINKLLSKPSKESSGSIKTLTKSDLLERRAQIFEELGYTALVERERSMRLVAAPKDYLPF